MLVSFLISSQTKDDKMFKTISSLKRQTNDEFEIIVFNDEATVLADKEHNIFLEDLFIENNQVTLVNNSKFQGHSFNWNLGIELAKGNYVTILKEGDTLESNYVETVAKIIAENPNHKIDIIQIEQNLTGLIHSERDSYLENDKLYELPKDKEVFAYVRQTIYGKIFRTKYLRDFRLRFRTSVRYDALFVYKALGHARYFYNSSANLITHKISVLKYSAFDLANQWPHILNYYRRIGLYKDIKDEVNYAYFYNLIFNFMLLVKYFKNQQLYKKAIKFVEAKLENKLTDFIKENEIFKLKKDLKFTEIINKFSSFIKNELRSAR